MQLSKPHRVFEFERIKITVKSYSLILAEFRARRWNGHASLIVALSPRKVLSRTGILKMEGERAGIHLEREPEKSRRVWLEHRVANTVFQLA